jgi:two-component system sensor histidine kinase YesM
MAQLKLRGVSSRIRRLSVGRKLVLIYGVGIFIPLVLANGLVLRSVLRDVRHQEEAFLNTTLDKLADDLVRELEPVEQVSDSIYADSAIYRLLADEYTLFRDYVEAHRNFLLPALNKYANVFQGISRMMIYTNNTIVHVSHGYLSIDSYVRSSVWYSQFIENGWKMAVMGHVDGDPRTELSEESYISLFRLLDNPQLTRRSMMILRIDLAPAVLARHLRTAGLQGHIAVVDPWGVTVVSQDDQVGSGPLHELDRPIEGSRSLGGWRIVGEVASFGSPLSWSSRWTFLLVVAGLSVAVSSLFILLLSRSVTSRLQSLSAQMEKVEDEDFSPLAVTGESSDEIDQLITDYNIMARKIDSLINDVYKSEIERGQLAMSRQQAELNALQSQVNPHFLFNVLESIRMRSHIKGEHETARVVKLLSRSFRRISSWSDDLITLEEELGFTREYIEIQQYRFGDRLNAEFDVDRSARKLLIPKLTVQSLVENACVHGLEGHTEGGTVRVAVDRDGETLTIRISDDGVGCDGEKVQTELATDQRASSHIGIANVWRRLRFHFGESCRFSFASAPGQGTTVTISIDRINERLEATDSR